MFVDSAKSRDDGVLAFEGAEEGGLQFGGGEREVDTMGGLDSRGEGRGGGGAGKDGDSLGCGGGMREEGIDDGEADLAGCL